MTRRHWVITLGIGLILSVALGMLMWALGAKDRGDSRLMLQRGLVALDHGDPRAARVELMNAIRADPALPAARIAQARVMLALGDGLGAKGELDRARALGAAPGATRHLMAHALLLNGDATGALREAHAADVTPKQAAYAARIAACALQDLGRFPQAATEFDHALALAPNDTATWIDLSRFRLGAGNRAAALLASDRAMALSPRDPAALTLRAELIRDQYGLKAALPWFDRVLAIDANYIPALTEYAATLADMGRAQNMLSLTRRILALDANNARAFFMQSVMAARAGNMGLARLMMDKVGSRLDDQPATMLLRGILLLEGSNATLAAQRLGALVALQPFNFQARLLYARALFESGQTGEADAMLTPLAERPDADSYTLTLAARVREALNDRLSAQAWLARASRADIASAALLPLDPDSRSLAAVANADTRAAGPNVSYIRMLLSQGDQNSAILRATVLRDANPGAAEAHVVLGDASAEASRWHQAALNYVAAANLAYSEGTALKLAMAWNRAGETERAEQALALYLNQNPRNIPANRLAATAWMRIGKWKLASETLESVRAQLGNDDAYLMTDLAWARLGQGDARTALTYARHAYRLLPSAAVTTDVYGWTLFKALGPSQACVDLLEKAVNLAPGNALLGSHLRTVYSALAVKR